jgi:hypothetical protein
MSFFTDLIAGGAAGLFSAAGSFAKDLRAAITGESVIDPNKRAELLQQAAALEAAAEKAKMDYDVQMAKAQTAINEIEAKSTSKFVAGWRPATGWICVCGLGYTFLLKPLLPWLIAVGALVVGKTAPVPVLPEVPMGDLIVLLMGMLGLGTLRTVEKMDARKGGGK